MDGLESPDFIGVWTRTVDVDWNLTVMASVVVDTKYFSMSLRGELHSPCYAEGARVFGMLAVNIPHVFEFDGVADGTLFCDAVDQRVNVHARVSSVTLLDSFELTGVELDAYGHVGEVEALAAWNGEEHTPEPPSNQSTRRLLGGNDNSITDNSTTSTEEEPNPTRANSTAPAPPAQAAPEPSAADQLKEQFLDGIDDTIADVKKQLAGVKTALAESGGLYW